METTPPSKRCHTHKSPIRLHNSDIAEHTRSASADTAVGERGIGRRDRADFRPSSFTESDLDGPVFAPVDDERVQRVLLGGGDVLRKLSVTVATNLVQLEPIRCCTRAR